METVNSSGFIERDVPKKKKKKLSKIGKITISLVLLIFTLIILFVLTRKVNSIKIEGNDLVNDEYILELLDLDEDSMVFDGYNFVKISQAKKDKLIDDIDIKINKGRLLVVNVKENKPVGQRVINDKTQLILASGDIIDYQSGSIKDLTLLPYFVDIDDEKTSKIAQKFAQLDNDNLFRISEVHDLSFTYDDDMVKLVMDEGYYIYSSLEGITYVKNYLQIIANDQNDNKCILIMEQYNKAIKMDCSELEKYEVVQNEEE